MIDFFQRALTKLEKLNEEQRGDLLVAAVERINLLRTVADSIDVGILVCDEKHKLVLANKCAQRLLPINYSEGIEIWSALKDDKIIEFLKDILLNCERVIGSEIDIVHHDKTLLLSINVVPLVDARKIKGALIYIEDITERRKVESRLRRAENLASLTTLAAGVAHEIKNPLGSISIHLQLLLKALKKISDTECSLDTCPVGDQISASIKKTRKYVSIINEEVDRLNSIVVDFLFAVRPLALELREGDINKIIKQLVEFVTPEMKQSNINFNLYLEEKLPTMLMDERLIKQSLLNLIKNAQAAMPDGGTLTITTNCVDNEIKIQITDTGIGIKKDIIPKIFEPYFTTKESGTGLGLTQVYKIIREHQGEITVSSKPKKGTCFEIVLPIPQKTMRLIAYNKQES